MPAVHVHAAIPAAALDTVELSPIPDGMPIAASFASQTPHECPECCAEHAGLLDLETYFQLTGQDTSGAIVSGNCVFSFFCASGAAATTHNAKQKQSAGTHVRLHISSAARAPCIGCCSQNSPSPVLPSRRALQGMGQPRRLQALRRATHTRRSLGGRRRRQLQLQNRQERCVVCRCNRCSMGAPARVALRLPCMRTARAAIGLPHDARSTPACPVA